MNPNYIMVAEQRNSDIEQCVGGLNHHMTYGLWNTGIQSSTEAHRCYSAYLSLYAYCEHYFI